MKLLCYFAPSLLAAAYIAGRLFIPWRGAILLVLLSAFAALAAATRPSVDRSDSVFTGKVLSAEKVKVQSSGSTKWELWKAKVRVGTIIKWDTKLPDTIFLYYEQDHDDGKRRHYSQTCPGRPRINMGDTKQFYCIRRDVGDGGKVLFIPEGGWVTAPSWPSVN